MSAPYGPQLNTELLRESDDPLWRRLNEALAERGVDPNTSVLAEFFPDNTNLEFGIVVTADAEVFEFDLVYGSGDIKTATRTAQLATWTRITDVWRDRPLRNSIEEALGLVAERH